MHASNADAERCRKRIHAHCGELPALPPATPNCLNCFTGPNSPPSIGAGLLSGSCLYRTATHHHHPAAKAHTCTCTHVHWHACARTHYTHAPTCREKALLCPDVLASDQVEASAVPVVSCVLSLRCLVTDKPSTTSVPEELPWLTETPTVWPVELERSRATCVAPSPWWLARQ